MERYFGGIDLGGTNIAAGIVNSSGRIIGRGNLSAKRERSAAELCRDMKASLLTAAADAGIDFDKIDNVGIGVPGVVYGAESKIGLCNNLNLEGEPVKAMMEDLLGKPVILENDGNAAIYGEMSAGAGKGKKNLIMLTLGTGIGSGIIIDGRIFSGFRGLGSEIGHMGIVYDGWECTCGRRGCFECYASAGGLVRLAQEMMGKYPDSLLHNYRNRGELLNGKIIFDAASKGDKAGEQAVEKYIKYLSYGIASCIYIFDPECIILGGGISNQGRNLEVMVKQAVEKEIDLPEKCPDIVCAELGNDAGIIGAALNFPKKLAI